MPLPLYISLSILWLGSAIASFAAGYALRAYQSYRKRRWKYWSSQPVPPPS